MLTLNFPICSSNSINRLTFHLCKIIPHLKLTLFHPIEACSPSLARQPLVADHGCGFPRLPGSLAERAHLSPKPSLCHRGPPRARSAFSVNPPCEGSARQGPSVNDPSFALVKLAPNFVRRN
jgi:hypothetical protein